jgi:tetratricopeptide (TPR) repeat protein
VAAKSAFPFAPRDSSIVVHLEELLTGRNLNPWALRAFAHPGPVLVLWFGLIAFAVVGARRMLQYFRAPDEEVAKVSSDGLPIAVVLAAALPIFAGFMMARPITDPPNQHALALLEAGQSAQKAGEAVTAAEDYAIVLGLDPSNKFARYDLGILQQNAGRVGDALVLYMSALRDDPSFAPARQRITALQSGPIR